VRLRLTTRSLAILAGGCAFVLSACPALHAAEQSPVWKDGWTINIPGRSNWVSDSAASPFDSRGLPPPASFYTPGSVKDPYGFADYSIGHSFGGSLGLGNMQATLGVRISEPLAATGFTPAIEPRRYLGVGPRLGFEGNNPLSSSWVVEWRVGASMLNSERGANTGAAAVNPAVPNYAASSGSLVNLDGLLGLSYWFSSASKFTVGYRADYFKGSDGLNLSGATAESAGRVDHGPIVRFSIQK
jgi:hypothetical protein